MQSKGEADADTCAFNDLALINIDPADVGKVNPSVPGFGGPTGVASWSGAGSTVYTYRDSELRGGVPAAGAGDRALQRGRGWGRDQEPRRLR
jgi:hypothetical protein